MRCRARAASVPARGRDLCAARVRAVSSRTAAEMSSSCAAALCCAVVKLSPAATLLRDLFKGERQVKRDGVSGLAQRRQIVHVVLGVHAAVISSGSRPPNRALLRAGAGLRHEDGRGARGVVPRAAGCDRRAKCA